MSKKRLISSVILCLALLRIVGWKGLIRHPRDRGKYCSNLRTSSFQPSEFDVGTSNEEDTFYGSNIQDLALNKNQGIVGISRQALGRNSRRPAYPEDYIPYLRLMCQSCTSSVEDILACSVELSRSL